MSAPGPASCGHRARPDAPEGERAQASAAASTHEDGVCTVCGQCLHEVILNGACYYCGSTDIDGVSVSPKPPETADTPAGTIVPAARLVRKKGEHT